MDSDPCSAHYPDPGRRHVCPGIKAYIWTGFWTTWRCARLWSTFRVASHFFKPCTAFQVALAFMTAIYLANILFTMSLSRSNSQGSTFCSSVLKALRWRVKSAEVGHLQVVHSVLIGTFLTHQISRDRTQTPPLRRRAWMQREERILGYNGTVLEFISLSTCLVMT